MRQDRELIKKMAQGHMWALEAIYDKYKEDMFTVAMSLLGNVHLAEDCVSDVVVHFAGSVSKLRIQGNLKGYLVSCAANRAKDIMRKKVPVELDAEVAGGAVCEVDPVVSVSMDEEQGRILEALRELSFEQQEVFVMRVMVNLKFREIAKVKKVSIKTVQSRYRYAIEKLRCILERQDDYEFRRENRKIS